MVYTEVKGWVSSFVAYQHTAVVLQELVDGECLAGDAVLAWVVERSVPLLIHAVSLEGGRRGLFKEGFQCPSSGVQTHDQEAAVHLQRTSYFIFITWCSASLPEFCTKCTPQFLPSERKSRPMRTTRVHTILTFAPLTRSSSTISDQFLQAAKCSAVFLEKRIVCKQRRVQNVTSQ